MDLLLAKTTGNELILSWDKNGEYHSSLSFQWRTHTIHMKIDVNANYGSTVFTITVYCNGKTFQYGVGRSARGAGSIGTKPVIETNDHYLNFDMKINIIKIKDHRKSDGKEEFGNEFSIINIPSEYSFIEEKSKEDLIREYKKKIQKNKLMLYEFSAPQLNINSLVYFEDNSIIVDKWKLGKNYEDELIITVSKEGLLKLYDSFSIIHGNSNELLIVICNIFKGDDSFESFENYLKLTDIPYSLRAIRD